MLQSPGSSIDLHSSFPAKPLAIFSMSSSIILVADSVRKKHHVNLPRFYVQLYWFANIMKLISCLISSPGFFFVNTDRFQLAKGNLGTRFICCCLIGPRSFSATAWACKWFLPWFQRLFSFFLLFFISNEFEPRQLKENLWDQGIKVISIFWRCPDLPTNKLSLSCSVFLVVLVLGDQIQYSHSPYACLCIKYFEEKIILITFRNFCILWK